MFNLKHLMVGRRGYISLLLGKLKGDPLSRMNPTWTRHHDFLVVNHNPKLLTRTDVVRHCDHILLGLLTWCGDN